MSQPAPVLKKPTSTKTPSSLAWALLRNQRRPTGITMHSRIICRILHTFCERSPTDSPNIHLNDTLALTSSRFQIEDPPRLVLRYNPVANPVLKLRPSSQNSVADMSISPPSFTLRSYMLHLGQFDPMLPTPPYRPRAVPQIY